MFSIVLYTFCSVVSLWTGRYFYAVWKKSRNADHLEFALFFFVLGLGFVIYLLAPVFFVPLAGVVAEVGLLVVLFSFAFVLRAFAHFARLPFSPNMLSIAVVALIGLKLMVWSVPWFLWPALNNALVRWDYPVIDSLVFGALVFIFSFSIAFTLITHSVGVSKHRRPLLFLGFAFFVGGMSGVLLPTAMNMELLWAGNTLLFAAFLLVSLFVMNVSRNP